MRVFPMTAKYLAAMFASVLTLAATAVAEEVQITCDSDAGTCAGTTINPLAKVAAPVFGEEGNAYVFSGPGNIDQYLTGNFKIDVVVDRGGSSSEWYGVLDTDLADLNSDLAGADQRPPLRHINDYESILGRQIEAGGLETLSAAILRVPNPGNNNLKVNWNKLHFDIDHIKRSATMRITTTKHYTDSVTGAAKDFIYRWEMDVAEDGLHYRDIGSADPKTPHRYFAMGRSLQIRKFEAAPGKDPMKLREIEFIFEDGTLNPLARVYSHSNADCIEIKSSKKLDNAGILGGAGVKLEFCAGSCSGFLLAATNS